MAFDKQAFCKRWVTELRTEKAALEARKLMHEGIVEGDELLLERISVQIEVGEEYMEQHPD